MKKTFRFLPEQMHLRMTSQSCPDEMMGNFNWSIISLSCCRTSRTLRIALWWMKCFWHHVDE